MATPTLDQQVIDLTDADEFDVLSIALETANARDLTCNAIDHLQSAVAAAHNQATRRRLRDAVLSLDRTRLLLSAVLDDVHQAASSGHRPAPASREATA